MSMADEIVSKTKELAFSPAPISNPFETHGGGMQQTIENISTLTGKELQESYRSGFGASASATQKVTGR